MAFFAGKAYANRKKMNGNSSTTNFSAIQQNKGYRFLWIFIGIAFGMLLIVIITFIIYIYGSRPIDSYSYDNDEVVWEESIEIEDTSDSEHSFYESTGNDQDQLRSTYVSEKESLSSTSSSQDTSSQNYPLGVAFFRNIAIGEIIPAVGNGVKASIVLGSFKDVPNNEIHEVYYVRHSFKTTNPLHEPPIITGLVYHDLGEDSFLGIKLTEYIYDDNNADPLRRMDSEVKLDEKSAQFLLDLITNDTKWINKTDINFKETKNPKVPSPEVYQLE